MGKLNGKLTWLTQLLVLVAKHHVLTYMEDSIAQLLEHREENPKINPIKILSE